MQVYFTVNVGRKSRDSSWCPLNRGCLLDTGFTVTIHSMSNSFNIYSTVTAIVCLTICLSATMIKNSLLFFLQILKACLFGKSLTKS